MEENKLSRTQKIWKKIESELYKNEEFAKNFSEENSANRKWFVSKEPNNVSLWRDLHPVRKAIWIDHSYIWTSSYSEAEWAEFKNEKFPKLIERFEANGQAFNKFETGTDKKIEYKCDLDNNVNCSVVLFDKNGSRYRGVGFWLGNCNFKDERTIRSLSKWIAFFTLIIRGIVEEFDIHHVAENHLSFINSFGENAEDDTSSIEEEHADDNDIIIISDEESEVNNNSLHKKISVSLNNNVTTFFYGITKFPNVKNLQELEKYFSEDSEVYEQLFKSDSTKASFWDFEDLPYVFYNALFPQQPEDSTNYISGFLDDYTLDSDGFVSLNGDCFDGLDSFEDVDLDLDDINDVTEVCPDHSVIPANFLESAIICKDANEENKKYEKDYFVDSLKKSNINYHREDIEDDQYLIMEFGGKNLPEGIYCALFTVRENFNIDEYCHIELDRDFDINKLGVVKVKEMEAGVNVLPHVYLDPIFFTYDNKIISDNFVFNGNINIHNCFQFAVFKVDSDGEIEENINLMTYYDVEDLETSHIRSEFKEELEKLLKK